MLKFSKLLLTKKSSSSVIRILSELPSLMLMAASMESTTCLLGKFVADPVRRNCPTGSLWLFRKSASFKFSMRRFLGSVRILLVITPHGTQRLPLSDSHRRTHHDTTTATRSGCHGYYFSDIGSVDSCGRFLYKSAPCKSRF